MSRFSGHMARVTFVNGVNGVTLWLMFKREKANFILWKFLCVGFESCIRVGRLVVIFGPHSVMSIDICCCDY